MCIIYLLTLLTRGEQTKNWKNVPVFSKCHLTVILVLKMYITNVHNSKMYINGKTPVTCAM